MKRETLDALQAARANKRSAALLTRLVDGEQRLVFPRDGERPADLDLELWEAAGATLARDAARRLTVAEADWFVEPFNPPLRMVIVGAVHIAQPLVKMAELVGFDVVVVDPRTQFSNETRFAGVERRTGWPDEELEALDLDARTAVVTLTHDPKLDDPGLAAALSSPAFYVGALGSRKTQAGRLERLRELGFDDSDLGRIHGPIGLDLGGRSPAEIATSILAQVVRVLRRAP